MTADAQDLESTQSLLLQAQAGDDAATGRLLERYREPLSRWARGRLPAQARGMLETADLVQVALAGAAKHLSTLRTSDPGVFHGYLRRSILNRVTDEVRKAAPRPESASAVVDSRVPDDGPSPIEQLIGRESLQRYERALALLSDGERAAVHTRIELGLAYKDVALALGKPSADAARMAVARAIARLASEMARESGR
ncbi:MAG: hypothetical protein DWQ36_14750 [Acidobacteria bacterium]|nr:MAG: hypothetical protein DWQ30_03485 [Acidobacteriota bacterium]REK06151.1 MAG: hypothetical protein DWQ36_14750 [Acidobacteriota bacterium]